MAYWLAYLFRFEFDLDFSTIKLLFFTWPYVLILQVIALFFFGVPNFSWRYVTLREATRIMTALAVATTLLVIIRLGLAPFGIAYAKFILIPLGVLAMNFALAFLGIAGVRGLGRILLERRERYKIAGAQGRAKRTLLIGAGRAGVAVAREIALRPDLGIDIRGFIDDDTKKIGTMIQGLQVMGDTASIPQLTGRHEIDQALITIASASGGAIRRIMGICEQVPLQVKIIPAMYEILDGRVNLSRIREVTIEDLLGRDVIVLDKDSIGGYLSGKRVMITGAGGSIGSELCRQVGGFAPETLVLFEQAENVLFEIHSELRREQPELDAVPCIGDICDADRVEQVFRTYRPQVVFHAAAHKHVPMMEANPGEAIRNNVMGTKQIADASERFGVDSFVLISTDKAVNPTSIMGSSKRMAELYVQAKSKCSESKFVAVRFGNVLGSAGSVIPIFREQIRKGGPVTVTHPEMKRYFMTIPEACQLVMQTGAMGEGGEIFVLDMGEPVRIVDLAKDLIRLSGFTEAEIDIDFTGVRPGEKLFEELSTKSEHMAATRHPKIFIGRIEVHPYEEIEATLEKLTSLINSTSCEDIKNVMHKVIPEMRESHECIAISSPAVSTAEPWSGKAEGSATGRESVHE